MTNYKITNVKHIAKSAQSMKSSSRIYTNILPAWSGPKEVNHLMTKGALCPLCSSEVWLPEQVTLAAGNTAPQAGGSFAHQRLHT